MSWTGDAPRVPVGDSPVAGGPTEPRSAWSAEDSARLYRVGHWGRPYFSVDARGHLAVRARPGARGPIELPAIVEEARRRGVEPPLMIRFPDILRAQVERLHDVFRDAVAATGYGNRHQGLYPVKVNPLRHVVAEILDAGGKYGMGLECGSKAELAAALALLRDDRRLLVCNGVKDESMLEMAMDAQRLGRRVIPVAQSPREFAAFRAIAGGRGDDPLLGVRIRLSGGARGEWDRGVMADTKFGLSLAELLALLERFPDMLPSLGLLHFHIGSQVTELARLRRAAGEAAQVYASLVQRGAGLRYLDVGGGLGVGYGDAGGFPGEPNYSMADYARAIVTAVNEVCRSRSVPHPVLVSETGRAVAAHHAVLIVPVLSVSERLGFTGETDIPPQAGDATLWLVGRALQGLRPDEPGQAASLLARACDCYREVGALFADGRVAMEERAVAERAFVTVARRALGIAAGGGASPRQRGGASPRSRFGSLERALADRILCDFSVFRSLPDHWGSGQAFPVMPIVRLDERPSRRGVLVDVTCDADGRINRYITSEGDSSVLPIHALRAGSRPMLGLFLMGAYEEVLGSAHNLLGRVAEIHVRSDGRADRGFRVERVAPATTVSGMLSDMDYSERELRAAIGGLVASAVAAGRLTPEAGSRMVDRYAACLGRGTYCGGGVAADAKP